MKKSIFILIISIMLACLVLSACDNGGGGSGNTTVKFGFDGMRILPQVNGFNGDEDHDVCLQVFNGTAEKYDVEINLNNPSEYSVKSVVFNDEEITSDKFGKGSNENKIYLRDLTTDLKSGEFTVTVSEIRYSTGSEVRKLTVSEENVKTVRVSPEFVVTFDMSAANLPEGVEAVSETTVTFGSIPKAPLDGDMNGTAEGQYGIDGYIFAGWYTEEDGGEKFDVSEYYLEYSDITLFARYARAVKYSSDGESITVTGFTDEGKDTAFDIIIPAEIDGLPVETIGRYAFSSVGSNKTFVLPDSVRTIEEGAFQNCVNMIIDLGSVVTIGRAAFQDCGVIYLGTGGKYSSTRVSRLPSTLTEIGDYAFRRSCFDRLSMFIPGTDERWYSSGNTKVLMIPASVKKIGKYAFQESLFEKVIFEAGSLLPSDTSAIKYDKDTGTYDYSDFDIGEGVFEGSASLTTVYTGFRFATSGAKTIVAADEGLKVITDRMFYNCRKLKSYDDSQTLPTGVYLGEGLLWIGSLAFSSTDSANSSSSSGMPDYTAQNFPASLEVIGASAFANSALASVTFPSTSRLKTLGDWCFQETFISEITLYSLSSYGKDPFWGNLNIRTINILTRNVPSYSVPLTSTMTRYARYYVYADMLYSFRNASGWADNKGNSFAYCAANFICAYEYVTDGFCYEPVNEAGNYDPNSTNVRISYIKSSETSASVPQSFIVSKGDTETTYTVTRIGGYVLNPEVIEIKLPDTVEYIEDYAFYSLSKLYRVVWTHAGQDLKDNGIRDIALRSIGQYAFYATALTKFYSNRSLTEIGAQAFHLCSKLDTVVLDDGDNLIIRESAFSQSTINLLIISKNVFIIEGKAFQNQTEALTLYIEHTAPPYAYYDTTNEKYAYSAFFPLASCSKVQAAYLFGNEARSNYLKSSSTGWKDLKKEGGIESAYVTYQGTWSGMLSSLNIYA